MNNIILDKDNDMAVIDLNMTLDTVNNFILCDKLDTIAVTDLIVHWLKSYLHNCFNMYVCMLFDQINELSLVVLILGPLLFLIYCL